MKKQIKALLLIFILGVLLIPSSKVKADSIAPSQVGGISFYGQDKSKFIFRWNYDQNIALSSDQAGNYGYETVISNLKGKKITTIDRNTVDNPYATDISISTSEYKVSLLVTNAKLRKQAFKIKVRAYTYTDAGEKLYGPYSKEKVIVPRATITSKALTSKSSSNVKVKWQKVSGAKSYTVYVSTKKTSGYKKKGTVKGTSFVIKNNKRYTDYYVYVVANNIKNGKKKISSTKPSLKYSNIDGYYIRTVYSY